jgi:hypothetical protein
MSAGTCKFCHCTEDDPCRIYGGDTCGWNDGTRTVCTAPGCMNAYFAQQRRLMAQSRRSTRKRTPGQIHALMKEERNAKQRASRARRRELEKRKGAA